MNPAGEYKYDIAISLCKEDAQYARDLKAQLNPGLKVFFYEDNQEEIISRCGTEVFASVFKEARVVVILSRKEWGQTFYTELEMHSITDRYKKEGLSFLVVIPMAPGEKPIWYPETMIYANPLNMTLEKIATVVEYRVTQSGGMVKPLTLDDIHQNLVQRYERKKALVQLQTTSEAASAAKIELELIREWTEQKRDIIKQQAFWNPNMQSGGIFYEFFLLLDGYLLEIRTFGPDEAFRHTISAQEYQVVCTLYEVTGPLHQLSMHAPNKKAILTKRYAYLYDRQLMGWAEMNEYKKRVNSKEYAILYMIQAPPTATEQHWHYDLKNPIKTETLVDQWFQELVKHSSKEIGKYL